MKLMTEKFETHGSFHVAKLNARRVLVFVTRDGKVGASKCFSRKQAFNRATVKPVPVGSTMAETLLAIMRSKGFPVVSEADELDDKTARAIEKEVFAV